MKKMSKIYLPNLTEKEAYGFTHKTPQGAVDKITSSYSFSHRWCSLLLSNIVAGKKKSFKCVICCCNQQ